MRYTITHQPTNQILRVGSIRKLTGGMQSISTGKRYDTVNPKVAERKLHKVATEHNIPVTELIFEYYEKSA